MAGDDVTIQMVSEVKALTAMVRDLISEVRGLAGEVKELHELFAGTSSTSNGRPDRHA